MPAVTIPNLPLAGTAQGNEIFPIVQNNVTKKISLTNAASGMVDQVSIVPNAQGFLSAGNLASGTVPVSGTTYTMAQIAQYAFTGGTQSQAKLPAAPGQVLGAPSTTGGTPVLFSVNGSLGLVQADSAGNITSQTVLVSGTTTQTLQQIGQGSVTAVSAASTAVATANAAASGTAINAAGVAINTSSISNLNTQVAGLALAQIPQGSWNAATNTPALTSSVGVSGYAYSVSVSGTTNLNGNALWNVGDTAIYNGSIWVRYALGGAYAPITSPVFRTNVTLCSGTTVYSTASPNAMEVTDQYGWLIAYLGPDGSPNFGGASAALAGQTYLSDNTISYNAVVDPNGYIGETVANDGSPAFAGASASFVNGAATFAATVATFAGASVSQTLDNNYTVTDTQGWIIEQTTGTAVATYGTNDYVQRNAVAFANSLATKSQNNVTAQRPVYNYNIVLVYGQSEAQGIQGGAPLSISQPYDNVMLGQANTPENGLPTDPNIANYTPFGGNVLYPLAAVQVNLANNTIQTPNQGGFSGVSGAVFTYSAGPPEINTVSVSGATGTMIKLVGGVLTQTAVGGSGQPAFDLTQIFSAGQTVWFYNVTGSFQAENLNSTDLFFVSSVTPTLLTLTANPILNYTGTSSTPISIYATNNNISQVGEAMGVAGVNYWRSLQLADRGLVLDPSRILGSVNAAVTSRTIAELSKGATPDLYLRCTEAVTEFVAAAKALNPANTVCVTAIIYCQGGSDVSPTQTWPYTYTAALTTLVQNLNTDLTAITGQTKPPIFVMQQIGASQIATDVFNDGIAMAHLNFALNPPNPNVYLASNVYVSPNQGLHPTINGYRWRDCVVGKVIHKILDKGEGWLPLYPTNLTYRGSQVLIDFHVPVPPLINKECFLEWVPTYFSDWGFLCTDVNGVNSITSVSLPSSCQVLLNCHRNFQNISFTGTVSGLASGTVSGIAIVSGSVLTVNNIAANSLYLGAYLAGTGVPPNTYIAALGTGAGGVGTYYLNNYFTISSNTSISTLPTIQYADGAVHSGCGNLFDSDQAVTDSVYSYTDFSGMPPVENQPSMIGLPYPMNNPCMLFNLPAVSG